MGGGVSPGGAAIGGNMSPQLPRRSWGSRESYTSDGDSGVGAESTTSRYAFGVVERKGFSCLFAFVTLSLFSTLFIFQCVPWGLWRQVFFLYLFSLFPLTLRVMIALGLLCRDFDCLKLESFAA